MTLFQPQKANMQVAGMQSQYPPRNTCHAIPATQSLERQETSLVVGWGGTPHPEVCPPHAATSTEFYTWKYNSLVRRMPSGSKGE